MADQWATQGLWGPMTHLLDKCALARTHCWRCCLTPAMFDHEWRIGHFQLGMIHSEGYRRKVIERCGGQPAGTDTGVCGQLYDDR